MEIHERVEELRVLNKLTVLELSKRVGKRRYNTYIVTKGERKITRISELKIFADALNVSMSVLLGEEEIPNFKKSVTFILPSFIINDVSIANNIQFYRKELGLSTRDFAKKVGLSYSYITRLERAENMPPPKRMCKICKVLNKDIGDLFYIIWDRVNDL